MKKCNQNVIINIDKDSIAEEMGIEKGDILVSINDKEIIDVFDYRYLVKDEYLEIVIEKPDGDEWLLEIEKDEDEDIGIVFDKGLMDNVKSCSNKCNFCFIDQLPKGMRKTLYFKDDDSRLSFLQGNYVTLTNMAEKDLERIIFYRLSPINVSVHTTDPNLRVSMLKNPKAAKILEYIKKISAAGIELNFQIVLCKNVNDKEHLDKSIEDLSQFLPNAKSLSVVPAGITKYRDNLPLLEVFTKEDAKAVIIQIEKWQAKLKEKFGTRFVFASDEFYLTAEHKLPNIDSYEDFPQIENGVGMLTNFEYEFNEEMKNLRIIKSNKEVSIITGMAAYKLIQKVCKEIEEKFDITIHLYPIKNNFFGEHITVSGLLTGTDILEQLKDKNLGTRLFIPKSALRDGEDVFLDDITLEDMQEALNTEIIPIDNDGAAFLAAIYNS